MPRAIIRWRPSVRIIAGGGVSSSITNRSTRRFDSSWVSALFLGFTEFFVSSSGSLVGSRSDRAVEGGAVWACALVLGFTPEKTSSPLIGVRARRKVIQPVNPARIIIVMNDRPIKRPRSEPTAILHQSGPRKTR